MENFYAIIVAMIHVSLSIVPRAIPSISAE